MQTHQPDPILHTTVAYAPWMTPQGHRLPGTGLCAPEDWLRIDEVYAPQMALRDRLLAAEPDATMACLPEAGAAVAELLATVRGWLADRPEFDTGADSVLRPDGVRVALDRTRPLLTLGRLVQEDFCILQKQGDEHVLTAAVLCFPSLWLLAEKLGRPLTAIHVPVDPYDDTVARRVQRLFDGLRPEVLLERSNCLPYDDWPLFRPRPSMHRSNRPKQDAPYRRMERQTLRRLPQTGAVVFTIHTAMLTRARVAAARAGPP